MSENTEYYKFFLTEKGWILGESKEWRSSESNPIEGHVFATLLYSFDGDCGYLCKPELELKIVDASNKEKGFELLEHAELPNLINADEFRKRVRKSVSYLKPTVLQLRLINIS